jgi:glyoxylase-like metal-dependent hydrolase (beta-lactamase superfamily II)
MVAAQPHPEEVALGVYRVEVGRGLTKANVYLVRSGPSWVLIDTAVARSARIITEAAESLFGTGARPTAILLTHSHPDHVGSALELARMWGLPIHVHPDELALATGDYLSALETGTNPLSRWLVAPLLRLASRRRRPEKTSRKTLRGTATAFDPAAGPPGLPEWRCVPTPGHTPGHVSFFRSSDRVLIAGDAVMTIDLNIVRCLLRRRRRVSAPLYLSTWHWPLTRGSVAALAALEPTVLASGHGRPMAGADTAEHLRSFSDSF